MGVMHRDLKPENFLFSGSELKATGFGLSVFIEGLPLESQTLTLTPNSVSSTMTRVKKKKPLVERKRTRMGRKKKLNTLLEAKEKYRMIFSGGNPVL